MRIASHLIQRNANSSEDPHINRIYAAIQEDVAKLFEFMDETQEGEGAPVEAFRAAGDVARSSPHGRTSTSVPNDAQLEGTGSAPTGPASGYLLFLRKIVWCILSGAGPFLIRPKEIDVAENALLLRDISGLFYEYEGPLSRLFSEYATPLTSAGGQIARGRRGIHMTNR